ncbi:hypothetical protein L596_016666 [Steinernema carpocapsae]|uniref:Uncharacterized protein n=1 Tax=Steinernema carpocapsae TaxID=34508 RepID=A0A4U5NIP0_STECR|nr:hypothetical protein L596_016666 [Steinernema carpocapsae]
MNDLPVIFKEATAALLTAPKNFYKHDVKPYVLPDQLWSEVMFKAWGHRQFYYFMLRQKNDSSWTHTFIPDSYGPCLSADDLKQDINFKFARVMGIYIIDKHYDDSADLPDPEIHFLTRPFSSLLNFVRGMTPQPHHPLAHLTISGHFSKEIGKEVSGAIGSLSFKILRIGPYRPAFNRILQNHFQSDSGQKECQLIFRSPKSSDPSTLSLIRHFYPLDFTKRLSSLVIQKGPLFTFADFENIFAEFLKASAFKLETEVPSFEADFEKGAKALLKDFRPDLRLNGTDTDHFCWRRNGASINVTTEDNSTKWRVYLSRLVYTSMLIP